MKKYIFYILILINLIYFKSTAQEFTTGIAVNAEIKSFLKDNPNYTLKYNKNKATLELPFWDDFSDSHIYPKKELWLDNYVYINSTLAEEPPSIGIATFDAANAEGEIYSDVGYETPFIADSLTSQSINLNYPDDNTIYLSFYYRPQGIAEAPEPEDFLILEFYAPEDEQWDSVWFAEGSSDPGSFEFVIIQISDDKYLKDGFQFRFKNYASLGSSTYPSLACNCDFWHIDYVYLNKNRTANDSVFHDIAFNKPLISLLNDYDAVPWSHFKEYPSLALKNTISVEYKNNDNATRLIDSLNFTLTDLSGNSETQIGLGGASITPPFEQFTFSYPNQPFNFPVNSDDFCNFNFNARIVTDSYDSTQNNSISYTQKFRDYYAYDDGNAEAGYGIYGSGAKFGSVAYFFDPLTSDNLTGVYMYFTHAYNEASQNYFWIYIWEQGTDGLPGDTIKTIEGILPEYEDELNKFHLYEFDEPISIDAPFFIGWTQTTDDKLNIGFDYNTVNNDKLFINLSGEWIQSNIEGSVMIRPAFGDFYEDVPKIKKNEFVVYPNPAEDRIFINFNNISEINYSVEIFDLQGRLIKSDSNNNQNYVDINNLINGVYIIRIIDELSNVYYSKFIKQ
ncbi:MAG: T9SS type A sorting domain-containing protein [Bacteroidales bacterium]|nr:T9SS type A sorting domain-containing protein [Bacteroidales bacterium]